MASGTSSVGYVLPIRNVEVRRVARPNRKQAISWSWGGVADAVSGIIFLALLGWTVWHIGGLFVQFAAQATAAACPAPVVNAAESIYPSSGVWPW